MNNSNETSNIAYGTRNLGIIFTLSMGIVLIVLNCASIYLLITSKTLAAQIKTLVLNLSLADLQIGFILTVIPFTSGYIESKWIPNFAKLFSLLSQFFTMTISVDRMVSVARPNFYLYHATEERTRRISRIIWITYLCVALLLVVLISIKSTFIDTAMDIFTVILYFIVLFCVLSSTSILYQHGHRIMKSLNINGFSKSKTFFLKNYKPTIILLTLCITFIILSLPMSLIIMLRATNPYTYEKLKGLLNVTRNITAFNHIVNPFLYIFRFKEFRERVLHAVCRRKISQDLVYHIR